MHNARQSCKRLLHSERDYALRMSSPNQRLKAARQQFFPSAGEAADALGVPRGTYAGHENGHRGFPAARAPAYARKFKVSEEWLLYGKGAAPDLDAPPSEEELEAMVRTALDAGVNMQTRLSDLPRIVAPVLREQLELRRADRAAAPIADAATVPGKGAQSPAPTKRGAPAG